MPKTIDENFKKEVVLAYIQSDKSQQVIAKEYNVSESALGRWVKMYSEECQYTTKNNELTSIQEIKRLNKELKEKEKEIAFLKKAAAFFAKEVD